MQLELTHLVRLNDSLNQGRPLEESLPAAIGDTAVCMGLWRFYSDSWPVGGVRHWNTNSQWKLHWSDFLPDAVFAFGEDVFGNQLMVGAENDVVTLWNHENGAFTNLYLNPVDLLTTALNDGIDWIDQYNDSSLMIARRFGPVANESHLHWTMPLFLGGNVNDSNISIVEREPHLVGHAKLWSQIR